MSSKNTSLLSFLSGLLSLMICWFFWIPVYGIILCILSLILSLVAIITGRNIRRMQRATPGSIADALLRNARFGRVLGYIGIFISLICFIFAILFTIYLKYLIQ